MMTQPMSDEISPAPLHPVATGFARPMNDCPAPLFDGWMVHAAALRRSLTTLLFPGQALMAYYGNDHTSGAAFAHGVPNQTWLSSATLVQDTRIRRDVMAAAGIAVPRGRAFTLKRGLPFGREFAEEIGYPVVVKPMVGESTVEVMTGLQNDEQLVAAVKYLERVPTLRPDFTTSSFAFTQILTPKTGTSTRTRPTYRYIVEEHVTGQYVRLLLSDGELLSAIHAQNGPWRSAEGAEDVTDILHPDLHAFAKKICAALPGLTVVAADIVVNDLRAPLSEQPQPVVVDVAERPWMQVQHAASDALPPAHARQILDKYTPVALRDDVGTSPINATFRWEGLSQVESDINRAAAAARAIGISMTVSASDAVNGVVSGEITGGSLEIALLNELLIEGDILVSPAMCVETRPHP